MSSKLKKYKVTDPDDVDDDDEDSGDVEIDDEASNDTRWDSLKNINFEED